MDLSEKIKERIKEQFFELLTDEELDNLIQKELDSFFAPTNKMHFSLVESSNGGWNTKRLDLKLDGEEMSVFQKMIITFAAQKTHERLNSEITTKYFNSQFHISDEELNENTKQLITDAIPIAMNNYFKNISMGMVANLRNEIQNNSLPRY